MPDIDHGSAIERKVMIDQGHLLVDIGLVPQVMGDRNIGAWLSVEAQPIVVRTLDGDHVVEHAGACQAEQFAGVGRHVHGRFPGVAEDTLGIDIGPDLGKKACALHKAQLHLLRDFLQYGIVGMGSENAAVVT